MLLLPHTVGYIFKKGRLHIDLPLISLSLIYLFSVHLSPICRSVSLCNLSLYLYLQADSRLSRFFFLLSSDCVFFLFVLLAFLRRLFSIFFFPPYLFPSFFLFFFCVESESSHRLSRRRFFIFAAACLFREELQSFLSSISRSEPAQSFPSRC